MHWIPVVQIWPEPDLAGFISSNPAGAEARAGFGNCGLQMQCGCI